MQFSEELEDYRINQDSQVPEFCSTCGRLPEECVCSAEPWNGFWIE